jgi:hypothetical protein
MPPYWPIALVGAGLTVLVLWDAFETIILPRRVTRRLRLTRLFYLTTWRFWSALGRHLSPVARREGYLSYFGPLSLLLLLVIWALGLIFGFGLLELGLGSELVGPEGPVSFWTTVYASGSNFFTLGIGDVTPRNGVGRVLVILEAGTGLAFLALVVGYVPVLYQAFSRREVYVSLLDARAGSPPSATELLQRYAIGDDNASLLQFLRDWELWAADILESHLSYPILVYYRSQHENQSWLAALTTILDTSVLILAAVDGVPRRPAELAFAIARHTAADLSHLFRTTPQVPPVDRLPAADLERLRAALQGVGLVLRPAPEAEAKLRKLRGFYEPYVYALSQYLLMPLPSWLPMDGGADAWQITAWGVAEGLSSPWPRLPAGPPPVEVTTAPRPDGAADSSPRVP